MTHGSWSLVVFRHKGNISFWFQIQFDSVATITAGRCLNVCWKTPVFHSPKTWLETILRITPIYPAVLCLQLLKHRQKLQSPARQLCSLNTVPSVSRYDSQATKMQCERDLTHIFKISVFQDLQKHQPLTLHVLMRCWDSLCPNYSQMKD